MPQSVAGYGSVPLKPGARPAVAELAGRFEGWIEWDQFELSDDRLTYAYDDIVTIGTAGDLDDFFEEIADNHAVKIWTHYGQDGETWYYGSDERSRLEAEIAELEAQERAVREELTEARAKLSALNPA
jgi:hypothetical protein